MEYFNISDIFDGIFCSTDEKASKLEGSLYDVAIKKIEVNKSDVFMIGDSKESDYINSLRNGIMAYRYFPVLHKINTNLKRIFNKYNVKKFIFNRGFHSDEFSEYALYFYYFCMQLQYELDSNNLTRVAFLSRGGYLLKKCFDEYMLFNMKSNVETVYIKNSRKVNELAKNNEKDRNLLKKYLEQEGFKTSIAMVDEGWNASSQINIAEMFGIYTIGFYLGTLSYKKTDFLCQRKGILFDIDENDTKSRFYGVFRSNCTFYEQICTSPEGSVIKYLLKDNEVVALQKSVDVECKLYKKYVYKIQNKIIDDLISLCCWNVKINKYELVKYNLKTQLLSNYNRTQILNDFDKCYFDNLNDTNEKKFGNIKKLKINIFKLFFCPDEYLRYLCKIKNLFVKNKYTWLLYMILGKILYFYCRLIVSIKNKIR